MCSMNDETMMSFRKFISDRHWQFAKTYAETAPHEYTIRDWKPNEAEDFDAFSKAISKYGEDEWWRGRKWRYLVVDDYKYWSMGVVINRVEIDKNE